MWDDLACGAVVYQLHFKRRVGDRVTPFFTKVSDSMPNALAFCCIGVDYHINFDFYVQLQAHRWEKSKVAIFVFSGIWQ
ncbi:hypothetical protein ACFX13_011767 [Malus domestica]